MERKLLKRYLVLMSILIVLAGAVWLFGKSEEIHKQNTVLALGGKDRLDYEVILEEI